MLRVSEPQCWCALWLARLAMDVRVQVALALVAIALAAVVGVAWGRRTAPSAGGARPEPPPLPEAHPIWDSWRAAWAGDLEKYLACFAPAAREGLEAELAAKGREASEEQLRRTAAAALAIELGPPERRSDGTLVFPVTVQHERDAERIDYRVVRQGPAWKIAETVPRGAAAAAPPTGHRLTPPAEQGE